MATTSKKSFVAEGSGHREYKYSQEISQMMFVFGEVQEPNPETVNLVEDIVRSQLIELVSNPCTLNITLFPLGCVAHRFYKLVH